LEGGGTPILKILFYIKNIPWNFFIESFFVGPNEKQKIYTLGGGGLLL
jgi:hypothetical protein